MNADVRDAIAANGYCLFAIGLKLTWSGGRGHGAPSASCNTVEMGLNGEGFDPCRPRQTPLYVRRPQGTGSLRPFIYMQGI